MYFPFRTPPQTAASYKSLSSPSNITPTIFLDSPHPLSTCLICTVTLPPGLTANVFNSASFMQALGLLNLSFTCSPSKGFNVDSMLYLKHTRRGRQSQTGDRNRINRKSILNLITLI